MNPVWIITGKEVRDSLRNRWVLAAALLLAALALSLQTYLGADTIIETHITRDMLERAEKIRLSNALRGVFEADLVY